MSKPKRNAVPQATKTANLFSKLRYPLKNREDMVQYLLHHTRYAQSGNGYMCFAFNVKVFPLDFTFATFYKQQSEDYSGYTREQYESVYLEIFGPDISREAYHLLHPELGVKYIWMQRARNNYTEIAFDSAQLEFIEGEAFDIMLDKNGKAVDMQIEREDKAFYGNNGGYACFEKVLGHKLVSNTLGGMRELLDYRDGYYDDSLKEYVISFNDLRKIYRFHVQMKALLTPSKATDAVQYHMGSMVMFTLHDRLVSKDEANKESVI